MLMILLEPRSEQIARSRRLRLLRPHRSLQCSHRITPADSRKSSKRNCKLRGAQIPKTCDLKNTGDSKSDSWSRAYKLFTANCLRQLGRTDRRQQSPLIGVEQTTIAHMISSQF